MKYLLSLAVSVLAAPALAHSGLADHAHPHDASIFAGMEMIVALLTIAAVGAAYFSMMSRAENNVKARK
jgi:hypothetical protein